MISEIRDYNTDAESIRHFLETFTGYDDLLHEKNRKYVGQIALLTNRTSSSVVVSLNDLNSFDQKLCSSLISNTHRFSLIFSNAVQRILENEQSLLQSYLASCNIDPRPKTAKCKDSLDVYLETCQERFDKSKTSNYKDPFHRVPDELLRRFEVYFTLPDDVPSQSIRSVKAESVGRLLSIKAIVARASEVRPRLTVGTYTCSRCGTETYQPISGVSYIPLESCPSKECQVHNRTGQLVFQTRGSKFCKFQELRVQEMSEQVPVGNIPRMLTIWCAGENSRRCQPGDNVVITGTLLPVQRVAHGRIMNRGLLTDLVFYAHNVEHIDRPTSTILSDGQAFVTEDERQELREGLMYERLSSSLAPEIYGHDDLKKALILLLVGGMDNKSGGMKIRGSINICMMGDPGVAKSQLLSFVARLSPRSQYTTGRGSSGVGLTAAVMRDSLTGEFVLEGGALVLADQGICCIDEFDKMSESDRVSIHEVMEQQTISVAKAGILTTLNARVSIVAAANPVYGRYNPHKTLEQNIQLPPALLSRFDLLWLLRDKPNVDHDLCIAKHIVQVHSEPTIDKSNDSTPLQHTPGLRRSQRGRATSKVVNASTRKPLEMSDMRRIIATCKHTKVTIPHDLMSYIISAYVQMREESRCQGTSSFAASTTSQFTSPRTLLALMRLASAHARLRLSDTMGQEDLDEAVRLTEKSRETLSSWAEESKPVFARTSPSDQIFVLIRNLVQQQSSAEDVQLKQIAYQSALEHSISRGFTRQQFETAIEDYERLNVVSLVQNGKSISLV